MGLLSHIEEADYRNKLSASSLTFNEFQDKYSINLFGIFKKIDGYYVLTKCFGFDLKSIVNMKIESSFFDDFLIFDKKNHSFTKIDSDIQTLVECFSYDLKDKFTMINLYKNKEYVLMICSNPSDSLDFNSIFEDLSLFTNSSNLKITSETSNQSHIYNISFEKAIKSAVINNKFALDILDAIYNQILFQLELYFPTPNGIKELGNYNLQLNIKAKDSISANLLKIQIQNNLADFLKDSATEIEIS